MKDLINNSQFELKDKVKIKPDVNSKFASKEGIIIKFITNSPEHKEISGAMIEFGDGDIWSTYLSNLIKINIEENIIGYTKSGKEVYENVFNSKHQNFTMQDHKDAGKIHLKLEKQSYELNFLKYRRHVSCKVIHQTAARYFGYQLIED